MHVGKTVITSKFWLNMTCRSNRGESY